MWYRVAKLGMTDAQLDQECKRLVRMTPFFKNLFKHFGVDFKEAWRLKFVALPLKGKLAECRDDTIVLDENYLSRHPLVQSMHLVAHELVHWLTKQKEQQNYFADPEEVDGFDWAIAYQISQGIPWDQIEATFLPLIRPHFNNDLDAKRFFVSRLKAARNLSKS